MGLQDAYLSLGSNLGDRQANLRSALNALNRERVHVAASSSVYETEPQGLPDQPWFLNIVVRTRAEFSPVQLLRIIQRIERQLGREHPRRRVPQGPRLIDIDILLFGSTIVRKPTLTLPHPRMANRRFVLEPLLELDADAADPATGARFDLLLSGLQDQQVRPIGGPLTLE